MEAFVWRDSAKRRAIPAPSQYVTRGVNGFHILPRFPGTLKNRAPEPGRPVGVQTPENEQLAALLAIGCFIRGLCLHPASMPEKSPRVEAYGTGLWGQGILTQTVIDTGPWERSSGKGPRGSGRNPAAGPCCGGREAATPRRWWRAKSSRPASPPPARGRGAFPYPARRGRGAPSLPGKGRRVENDGVVLLPAPDQPRQDVENIVGDETMPFRRNAVQLQIAATTGKRTLRDHAERFRTDAGRGNRKAQV